MENNELLHAAKNILIEWDSRCAIFGGKEELKTVFKDTPTPHSYWSPGAMLVSSKYIAELRAAVEKLEL